MDKKKVLYISLLFIITVIVSITYFSYAFFTSKEEYHGKINVVAGTLDYKIESNDLTNNSITLNSNETKKIEVEITSLNEIASKYELYYITDNSNIEIGYAGDTIDSPSGEIGIKSSKKVSIIIKNKTNSSATISFGVQGGLVHNQIALDTGKNSINEQLDVCLYTLGEEIPFLYNGTNSQQASDGTTQTFIAACSGTYKLEVWGAQGGTYENKIGGYGGYAVGNIELTEGEELYINVGESGKVKTSSGTASADLSFNGGGNANSGHNVAMGGGGATSISIGNNNGELKNYSSNGEVLIVAGGGGGGHFGIANDVVGSGGGFQGVSGKLSNASCSCTYTTATGGTQTIGGNSSKCGATSYGTNGIFGLSGITTSSTNGGGGGGYYGGGFQMCGSGAGGSGYIANSNLTNKAMYCYKCTEAINTTTDIDIFTVNTLGTSTYRDTTNCPNGYSSDPVAKCAKSGNGYAKITYLGTRTVTFNANGGTVSETERIVNYGSTIGELPIPTRNSDYFVGWYLEDTFTTKVESTYEVNGDITLYAKFATCSIAPGTVVKETGYTGSADSFTVPCYGKYKLEVWGAQGGTNSTYGNNIGGYGGYSTGIYNATLNQTLYVVVGGAGASASGNGVHADGGYNGGGSGWAAGGGGATHISETSGLLSTLSSNQNSILIVAGGGGGGANTYGGHAGGYVGGNGGALSGNYANSNGKGGTQTSGGEKGTKYDCGQTGAAGAFGLGGSDTTNYSAGGGAGWYGGGSGTNNCSWNNCGTGGGGSGYIANSDLTNKSMYCYNCTEALNTTTDTDIFTVNTMGTSVYKDAINCSNGYSSDPVAKCAKSGNGYARITYIGN